MRANRSDSEIEIVVWDTGVGIAQENMVKIFEGFSALTLLILD